MAELSASARAALAREVLSDLLIAGGAAAICYGFAAWWEPAAWVVGGGMALFIGRRLGGA